ncbi:MAG: acetyl-CoA carboxylase carboxyl transferase subunit beta, partial [Thermomicrobium sp.]
RDPDYAAVLVLDAIVEALDELHDISPERLVRERYRKFRRMGQTNTYFRELVAQEVAELSGLIGRTLGGLRERLPFGREEEAVGQGLPGSRE